MRTVIPANATLIPPEAKRVFQGVLFDVYQWQQRVYDGTFKTFEMLERPDSILVIPIKDGKIVIEQEQQPGGPETWGLPGGRHDQENETELDAAKRELAEETGLVFKTWKLLYVKQAHPKIDHFIYVFLATNFEKITDAHLDSGEKISVHLMDFQQVKALVGKPNTDYIGEDVLNRVSSLDELLDLPEYNPAA